MLLQIQDTLKMLHASQLNSNLTVYEEMKGKFDWNKTPIAPLWTNVMIYIVTNVHSMPALHYSEALVTGMASHHYRLLELCVPVTDGHRILERYRLGQAYCTIPMTSEEAATDLHEKLKTIPPLSA